MKPGPGSTETLRAALRRASDDLLGHAPPATLPAAAWKALPRRPRGMPWRMALSALGALAVLTVGVALLASRPLEAAPVATPFLPVAPGDRWTQLVRGTRDDGPAWVVSTELPRESLAAMGLPYDPARAAEPVRAELLVHASGDVLAVRFVR
jgi:hypothetical protein